MRGDCSVGGAGTPGSGVARILFLTVFAINFARFKTTFLVALRGFKQETEFRRTTGLGCEVISVDAPMVRKEDIFADAHCFENGKDHVVPICSRRISFLRRRQPNGT